MEEERYVGEWVGMLVGVKSGRESQWEGFGRREIGEGIGWEWFGERGLECERLGSAGWPGRELWWEGRGNVWVEKLVVCLWEGTMVG